MKCLGVNLQKEIPQIIEFESVSADHRVGWHRHKTMRNGHMKLFAFKAVLCMLILVYWQLDSCFSRTIEPQVRCHLSNDVSSVSASIYRWAKIPYTNEILRCLGGKANFNLELEKSKRGIICPFGPVARDLKRDLPRYSARVTVPIARGRRQVLYESPINGVKKICYDSQETNTVAVLLTVHNIMTRMENLEVVELKSPTLLSQRILLIYSP